MSTFSRTKPTFIAVLAAALLTPACDVSVKGEGDDQQKNVDIKTPVGDLSVRTNVGASETGLPIYPGAQPLREDEDGGSADVNIGTPSVGLRIVAAKFESADAPPAIVEFYKDKMKAFGEVQECRGDFDFEAQRPVCKQTTGAEEIQLVTGTEDHHRIVSVKERGSGSEFAVVHIQIREEV
jgi:hypothetical protein